MVRAVTILLCFGFVFGLRAQDKWSDDLHLKFSYGQGFVLPEYDFINLVTERPTEIYEISLLKQTNGSSDWQLIYMYPAFGLRFQYASLGSPEVLGEIWALYPYFKIPIYKGGKIAFDTEIGLGYSRVNRKFDLENNFMNVAVGSYANFHFNARFNLDYSITDRISLGTALSFDHFSNGNTSEPNLGINYLNWLGNLSYRLGNKRERLVRELEPHQKKVEKELVIALGGKHTRALASTYYLTNSISFEMRKHYFRALQLGLGADLFIDRSVEEQLQKQERGFQNSDQYQTGIHFSQTLVYNRISIGLQEGIYLGLAEQVEGYSIYSRGIFKYRITDHFSARLSMKSHLHILDYPEIGFGWIW